MRHIKKFFSASNFVLLISIILCTTLFFLAKEQVDNNFKNRFINDSLNKINHITNSFRNIENQLISLKAFYLASDYITREEFKVYVSTLLTKKEIKRVNFAPVVLHKDRAYFERELKAFNSKIIGIMESDSKGNMIYAKDRDFYVPLFYVEPEVYQSIVGYDVYSDSVRRRAIDIAITSNSVVASEPTELLIKESKGYGVVVYVPVYKNNIEANKTSYTINDCYGLLMESMFFKDILDYALSFSISKDVVLLLYDSTDKNREVLAYKWGDGGSNNKNLLIRYFGPSHYEFFTKFNFASRVYKVVVKTTEQCIISNYLFYHWFIVPVSIVFILLLHLFVRKVETQRERDKKLIDSKTAELKSQKEELESFFNIAIDLLCIADVNGYFRKLNKEWERVLGYKIEELEGKRFLDFVHPDDIKPTLLALGELAKQKEVKSFCNRYRNKDGTYRWIEWRSAPKGNLVYASARDITDAKKSQEALLEREIWLNEGQKASKMGIYNFDIKTGLWRCTSVLEEIFGIPTDYDKNIKGWLNLVHPDQREEMEKYLLEHIETGEPFDKEYKMVRYDNGETIWVYGRGVFIKDDTSGSYNMIGSIIDITDKKKHEDALRESESRYKYLFDTMAQGVVYQDKNGKIFSVNQAALNILGITYEQAIGKDSFDPRWGVIHEDGSPFPGDTHPAMIVLKTGKEVKNVLMGIFNPVLNRHIWAVVNAVPIFKDNSKKPDAVFATITDITAIKDAEDALKRSELKFHSLYNSMAEGVALHKFVFGKEGEVENYIITDVNPRYEEMLGLKKEDVKDKLATEVYGTPTAPYLDEYKKVLDGTPRFFETYFPPMDKYFAISVTPLPEKGFATIFTDITEKKKLEEEREKFFKEIEDKNRELEKFVYTVSHDLKNPLITIQGFSGLIESQIEGNNLNEAKKSIEYIKKSANNMNELLNDLLQVSRIGRVPMKFEKIKFLDLIKDASDIVRAELDAAKIKLTVSNSVKKMKVFVDRKNMIEVLQNLISNAIKFMGDQKNPAIEIGHSNGAFYVKDNGIGIEEKYYDKIFELFERLDKKVDGTGVGLAIVKRVIEAHNGRVWAESDGIGKGTTFKFTLWDKE